MQWDFETDPSQESAGFSLLVPGEYRFQVVEKEDRTTASTGRPSVSLKVEAVEGPSQGFMFHNVTQIPAGEKGHGFLLHFLHAVGLPYQDGRANFDTDEFIGREFLADVVIEDYVDNNGAPRQRNKIKRVLIEEVVEAASTKAAAPAQRQPTPVNAKPHGNGGATAVASKPSAVKPSAQKRKF